MCYLVPGPTPCPEVVTISYIRPAKVLTLFSVKGDTQVEQKNHECGFLTPRTTCSEEQETYDKEDIRALVRMHMTSDEEEQEDYEPGQDSWQISRLVSADTFGASHDTGNVRTGRMKIT